MRFILIDPKDKSITEVNLTPTFEGKGGMYEAIGCTTIEVVRLSTIDAYVNEEGLLDGTAEQGGVLLNSHTQPLVGRVLLSGRADSQGNITDCRITLQQATHMVRLWYSPEEMQSMVENM